MVVVVVRIYYMCVYVYILYIFNEPKYVKVCDFFIFENHWDHKKLQEIFNN